jgi:hypothetical protein
MTRNALLGIVLVVFCVGGLAVGIARVAPGSNAGDILVAAAAAVVGAAGFVVVLRLGRRGSAPWVKWLLVPGLVAAIYVDRLSERWQLAVLAVASGYVAAFLVTVVVRAVRLTR